MKKLIITLLFLLIFIKGFGQSENINIPNLSPPSPTAFELGKYGMESVGLFTGTPNVNIPLYTYKTSKISVPLYLSYNSNGIKVDQVATNVGLGWSLNAGGVISRIARDGSDEHNDFFFPEEELSSVGVRSPLAVDFFWKAGQTDTPIDTELDLFSYNFQGHAGKFIIDNDNKIVEMPKSGLKIENYSDGIMDGFMISTPDGMKYIFLEKEETISRVSGSGHTVPGLPITTAWYLTKMLHPSGEFVNFIYESDNYNYTANKSQTLQVLNPPNQSLCNTQPPLNNIFPSPSTALESNIRIVGKKLVEINSSAELKGKLLFTSNLKNPESDSELVENIKVLDINSQTIEDINLDYRITGNNRVFLNKVQFMNPDKNYELSYIDTEGFPLRLSYSQDHWGYFNGKNNSHAFPNPQTLENMPTSLYGYMQGADKSPNSDFAIKGLLNKIKYPTRGSTEFEYEANTFRGIETINSPQTSKSLTADTGAFEMGSGYDDVKTIYIPYTQEVNIALSAFFNNSDTECHDTGKSKSHFSIQNASGNYVNLYKRHIGGLITNLGNGFAVGPDSSDNILANLIGGNTYTITLKPSFECVRSSANVKYYDQSSQTVESNIPTGGLRVKRLKKYTSEDGNPELTRYYYGKKENLNISSADVGQKPYYISDVIKRTACLPALYNDVNYINLNSNSLRKLYNSSGFNTTYYEYVTTSHGGDDFQNGGEENQYYIDIDYPGYPIWGNSIDTAPYNNNGWKNGLMKTHSIFKLNSTGNYVLLKTNSKNYVQDQRLYDEVLGYSVYKKFDLTYYGDVTYECKEADLNKVYKRRYCKTNHEHLRGPLPFDGKDYWVCTKFDANNVEESIPYPCNQSNGGFVGKIITNSNYLENLDITEYTNYSFWFYLNSEINMTYDEEGNNPIESFTEYFYDNPLHLQLSRTETTDSKGNKIVSKSYYPDDVQNVNGLAGGSLTTYEYQDIDNMKAFKEDGSFGDYYIGTPVQTEVYLKESSGIKLSESIKRTLFKEFNNSILPEKIQTSKGSSQLIDRVIYKRYSPEGNPLEVSQADGPSIVYLWGYNHQYPLAKIENASYQEVATALDVTPAILDTYSETNLSAINGLRAQLPKSMVTTYTYEPLVGLKSITDPKGLKTTYEYDSFNRLEFIKDFEGNILKEHKYNYKNQ